MATQQPRIIADGKVAGVGALAPLVAATRSPSGTWILAGGAHSYHGPTNVLFTRDGRKLERIRPPKDAFNLRSIHAIDDRRILIGGQGELHITADGGATWKAVKDPLPGEATGWWTIAACEGRIWACGNSWIIRSDDGKNWTGLRIRGGGECYGLALVSRDEGFVADEGKIHHIRGDDVRVAHKCPGVYVAKIARGGDGTLVAAGSKGTVLRSRDGGKSWSKVKVPAKRDYVAAGFHAGRFYVGGGKGTLVAIEPDGAANQVAIPTLTGDSDEVLGFAPIGAGLLVLAGRDMGASMNRRGVAVALGDLGGGGGAAQVAPDAFELPSLVARKRASVPKRALPRFETRSHKDVKKRFKRLPTPEAAPTEVRVYPAMHVGALDLVAEPGESLLVIVDGDLHVDGAVTITSCEDDDSYLTVHIAGNVSAESIALYLDPRVAVAGDAEVADLVSCGDGRAYLDIGGSLRCRLAIAAPHAIIRVKKRFTGMAIGDGETFDGADDIHGEEMASRVLSPKFVDKDTSAIRPGDVWRALRKGTVVTRR